QVQGLPRCNYQVSAHASAVIDAISLRKLPSLADARERTCFAVASRRPLRDRCDKAPRRARAPARPMGRSARRRSGAKGISYFASLPSPFFTPASGKIHTAATMNTAVTITNIESSGRIGEPLQNASTAATISATAETPALTSVGTAIAPCLQLAPTGTAAPPSGRPGAPPRFPFTHRLSLPL